MPPFGCLMPAFEMCCTASPTLRRGSSCRPTPRWEPNSSELGRRLLSLLMGVRQQVDPEACLDISLRRCAESALRSPARSDIQIEPARDAAKVGNPPDAGAELQLLRPPPRAVVQRQGAPIRQPEDVGLVRVEGPGDRYAQFRLCGEDAACACQQDRRDRSARK